MFRLKSLQYAVLLRFQLTLAFADIYHIYDPTLLTFSMAGNTFLVHNLCILKVIAHNLNVYVQ